MQRQASKRLRTTSKLKETKRLQKKNPQWNSIREIFFFFFLSLTRKWCCSYEFSYKDRILSETEQRMVEFGICLTTFSEKTFSDQLSARRVLEANEWPYLSAPLHLVTTEKSP